MKSLVKALQSKVAKSEGKKVQTSIGNVREILGIVSDELYKDALTRLSIDKKSVYAALLRSGQRRSKRK